MKNNWMVPTQSRLSSALATESTKSHTKHLPELPISDNRRLLNRQRNQPKYKPSYRNWDEIPLDCEAYQCLVDRGDFD